MSIPKVWSNLPGHEDEMIDATQEAVDNLQIAINRMAGKDEILFEILKLNLGTNNSPEQLNNVQKINEIRKILGINAVMT